MREQFGVPFSAHQPTRLAIRGMGKLGGAEFSMIRFTPDTRVSSFISFFSGLKVHSARYHRAGGGQAGHAGHRQTC